MSHHDAAHDVAALVTTNAKIAYYPCHVDHNNYYDFTIIFFIDATTTTNIFLSTSITTTILDATRPPTSPANQQAAYVRRLDAGVVIRSVESSGASNLRASEASFEAFGGFLGGFLEASWDGLLRGPWGV